MEFRILGPLEVVGDDGAGVAVGGSRERAVLALLLVSANRVVSSERLIDDLWGDHPLDGAAHALQVHMSRLRKALREAGGDGIVITQTPGYVARVDAGAVDAIRFESLVAEAREQAAGGHHEEAATILRTALGLWRGPALADVADAPLARAEAARLEEARLAALENRVEADLACGSHGQLVAELDALTRAHPLRERLWGHRMVALYRAGRQAEALRAYQDVRAILSEEMGLEPAIALQRLEGAILRHEPELDWPPAGVPAQPAPSSGSAPIAPGGVVTFLFTDLVGSTELLDSLGDDEAEELRRTHFALLRQAVRDAGGDEVKNLGDGLMVAFASPLAAVRCSVAIQEVIAEHNRSVPERTLRVRVGLHAGEPIQTEEDFFGTAVVVAKRLCDRAEGGEILASALVTDLVGSRGGFLFASLGPLELKGLAAPVATVAVEWQRPNADEGDEEGGLAGRGVHALPMPALQTEMGRLFVGRDAELKQLERLWAEAEEGQLRLALLSGEPGVGKTRLAGELARILHSEGSTVLVGRCDEDLGVPYQPFVEALHHFVEHTPPAVLARRLGRRAGELVRIYPDLVDRLRGLAPPLRSDPETERYRLFEAVAAWLATASSDQPMLLVLDDLQWATKPTLLLLRHVMRSAGPAHLLVLGIYRDTELSHDHPLTELLADFRRQPGAERLALSGLDEADVIHFMAQAAGHELDDDGLTLARVIHTETDGNPFFVREIIRDLTETGGIEQRDGRWGTGLPVDELVVPEGIREVVGRRLSRLSPDTGHALRVAAVIGPEFDLAVVGAAGELDEDRLLCAVEEAIATRLVVEIPGPVPRHRFTHALVRGTLYRDLSAARRVTLHRKVALAIEAAPGADDRLPGLAYHWARAAAPAAETDRAVDYAIRAGDRALAQLAHDEAAGYYTSALELLDAAGAGEHDPRRLQLLISCGEAEKRAGIPACRQTLLDAAALARQLGDAPGLARAALANTRGHMWTGVFEVDAARVEVLEAAIAAVGEDDLPVRARLLATLGLELSWSPDPTRRLALSDEALGIAQSLGDPATLAHVLLARDYTTHSPDNAIERVAATTELLAIAESLGDPVLASRALSLRFKASMELADVAEAERCVARNQELVTDLGQPILTWAALQHRATLRVLHATADAKAAIEASRDLAPIGMQGFFAAAHGHTFSLEEGRMAELDDEFARPWAERTQNPLMKSLHAQCLVETGQVEAATEVFDEFAASDFAYPTHNVAWIDFKAMSAWLCARLGRAEHVPRLRAWLEPYAEQLVVGGFAAWVPGSVAFYLGLLCTTVGDWPAAEAHFATAAATLERVDAPIWLARTRLEWARMLLARNEPDDDKRAGELLSQALTTAGELELPTLERDARDLQPSL